MIIKPNNKSYLHIAHISHHIVLVFPSQHYLSQLVMCIACVRARGVTAVIYTRDSPATSSIALSRVHQETNRSLTATWSWTYFYKCSFSKCVFDYIFAFPISRMSTSSV